MIKTQKIYKAQYSSRIYSNVWVDGEYIGLTPKEKVYIYEKGDSLLYTHESQSPDPGYTIYKVQTVEKHEANRSQVTLPAEWIKQHGKDLTHVKVEYTIFGLFVKPDRG